jgi:hypothetical protein
MCRRLEILWGCHLSGLGGGLDVIHAAVAAAVTAPPLQLRLQQQQQRHCDTVLLLLVGVVVQPIDISSLPRQQLRGWFGSLCCGVDTVGRELVVWSGGSSLSGLGVGVVWWGSTSWSLAWWWLMFGVECF